MLPNCVSYDFLFTWTSEVAHKFNIPSVCFPVTCCFSSLLRCCLHERMTQVGVSDDEPFVVPGLPDRIELTKAELIELACERCMARGEGELMKATWEKAASSEKESDGMVVNSFYELEPAYEELYKEVTGKPIRSVGPVSLWHREWRERGKTPCVSEEKCLEWLGTKRERERSVLYISFGSIASISKAQMEEIMMALRTLSCFFIWVIKELEDFQLIDCLGEEKEARDEGLIIRGWAPEVVILSHPSVGVFLTHCSWNSVIEAISVGVAMLTWPLFGGQHLNEELVVQVLGIGVKIGNAISVLVGEEEHAEVVRREVIEKAVERVMGPEEEGERKMNGAWKLREMARKAVERRGGSSSLCIDVLMTSFSSSGRR